MARREVPIPTAGVALNLADEAELLALPQVQVFASGLPRLALTAY